jgi:hypothetical protein
VAASHARVLSTQASRLKACFPAMSALRRFAVGLLIVVLCAGSAYGETGHITFLLVNDIYLMTDQMMPDGKRRGGFARLAAVVKAERAKGGKVIFAHAGDTLSPSLMSGIDRGAHTLALANLITPDIFTPGLPTVTTTKDAAEALRRDGAGFVVAVVPCAPTSVGGALY